MKKLIYTFGAALVMLASVSCQKKGSASSEEPVEKKQMTFTASASAEKTTVTTDGTTVVWSDGDAIRVFANGETSGDVCDMTSEAGKTYATFEGQCAKQGPWAAICPAFDGATYSDGAITFTMPAEQTYAENTFAQGAMPCVAYSETTEFTFNHSFGVLKLSLKLASGKTGSVKSITVTSKGTEKLNGTFAVSPKTSAKATKSGTDGTNAITLNCGSGVALGTTATDFWIVVPAGAFASGFDVEITATDDKVATLSTENDNTIKVGEIKPMPEKEIEFVTPAPRPACQKALDANANWVKIGGQYWLKQNTKCIEYDTESEAFEASWLTDNTIPTSSDPVYTPYYTPTGSGDPDGYGYYYNWAAAVGVENGQTYGTETFSGKRQGICPNGSHIPTADEWNDLKTFIETTDGKGSNTVGKHLRSNTADWNGTKEHLDTYGFAALPAGFAYGSIVYDVGYYADFWTATSTEGDSYSAYYGGLYYDYDGLNDGGDDKSNGHSVRCLRD